jgi:hypothetical protein
MSPESLIIIISLFCPGQPEHYDAWMLTVDSRIKSLEARLSTYNPPGEAAPDGSSSLRLPTHTWR